MVKPQQPELRRNDRGATSDDAAKQHLTAPSGPATDGAGGPVPEGNAPGHHPEHEQDQPSGADYVAKTHALAQEDAYEAPSRDDEVLDLTDIEADHVHTTAPARGDRLAELAGKPFALVSGGLRALRDRLPPS